jgi:intraflagellar transport protein 52
LVFLNSSNKNDITPNLLNGAKLLVLAGPQDKYTEEEFKYIKVNYRFVRHTLWTIWHYTVSFQDFITVGGALLVLLGEGGENDFNTNINFLLEEYGMNINNGNINL